MNLRDVHPWSWSGPLDRAPYAAIGAGLMAVKLALDAGLAMLFGQSWSPLLYWLPSRWLDRAPLTASSTGFVIVMVAMSLPFAWIGVGLTLRRLRATALPAWLVLFFFVSGVNVMLFLGLALLPSRPSRDTRGSSVPGRPLVRPWAAALATAAALLTTVSVVLLSVLIFGDYGLGLFLGVPFAQGFVSSLVYARHRDAVPRSEAALVSLLSLATVAAVLMVVALEGVICLLMAAPLAIPFTLMGTVVARLLMKTTRAAPAATALGLALPALLGIEHAVAREPRIHAVTTTIEIDAPPAIAWRHVVSFPDLPPPVELPFRAGIAYPIGATIEGIGVGAMRRCRFSTGDFLEPIEIWDEPRLLRFGVIENPPPLRELNPFGEVRAPHLHGYLAAERGEFRLEPLGPDRTLVAGTTWYRHGLWPDAYWTLWSDPLIHRIHGRVLAHVKALAEKEQAAAG